MPVTLTGDPDLPWIASFDSPAAGDKRSAGSVTVPNEALAHRTAYLEALRHPEEDVTVWLEYADCTAEWVPANVSSQVGWQHPAPASTAGDPLPFALSVPNGVTLTRVEALIAPKNSHVSIPSTRPKLQLIRWQPAVPIIGTASVVAQASDSSLTVSDYNLPHAIGFNLTHVVAKATHLYRVVFTDAGAGGLADMIVHGVKVTFDMTHLDRVAS